MESQENSHKTHQRPAKKQRSILKKHRNITRAISRKINPPFEASPPEENPENLRSEQIKILQKTEDVELFPTSKENFSQQPFTTISKKTQLNFEFHVKSAKTPIFSLIIFRILPSSLLFWLGSLILIFLQIEVNDFCFYPERCECRSFLIYIYAIFKDALNGYFPIIIFSFYGFAFATNSFYAKPHFRNVYISNSGIILIFFYGVDYEHRFESIHTIQRRRNWLVLLVFQCLYGLLLTKVHQNFNREFWKKSGLMILFQFIFFSHVMFLKSFLLTKSVSYFSSFKDPNYTIDSSKLFLLGYILTYWYICLLFFAYFYRKIVHEKNLSLNIVIFMIKYVISDVWLTFLLNFLTSKLYSIYTWFHFLIYFYTIITTYMGKNVISFLWNKFYSFLFRKKVRKMSVNMINFHEIVNNCILYVNLILLYRIVTLRFWDYFIYFRIKAENYEDCSLKEANSFLQDYDLNLMIVCFTNLIMIFAVVFYSVKKKEKKILFWDEKINFWGKMFYFFFLFQFSDQGLQLYKEFIQFE